MCTGWCSQYKTSLSLYCSIRGALTPWSRLNIWRTALVLQVTRNERRIKSICQRLCIVYYRYDRKPYTSPPQHDLTRHPPWIISTFRFFIPSKYRVKKSIQWFWKMTWAYIVRSNLSVRRMLNAIRSTLFLDPCAYGMLLTSQANAAASSL